MNMCVNVFVSMLYVPYVIVSMCKRGLHVDIVLR